MAATELARARILATTARAGSEPREPGGAGITPNGGRIGNTRASSDKKKPPAVSCGRGEGPGKTERRPRFRHGERQVWNDADGSAPKQSASLFRLRFARLRPTPRLRRRCPQPPQATNEAGPLRAAALAPPALIKYYSRGTGIWNLRILDHRVLTCIPKMTAAPFLPATRPRVWRNTF